MKSIIITLLKSLITSVHIEESIVNGQTSMVWRQILQIRLSSLPQKPIKLYRKRINAFLLQILFHPFHRYYCACPNLYFQLSIRDFFSFLYLIQQFLTILKHSFIIKNLRYSVVRVHRQFMYISEMSQTLPLVFSINVSNQYLAPFVEMNLMPFVNHVVLEIFKILSQNIQQRDRRIIRRLNQFYKRIFKFVCDYSTHLSQYPSSLICERNFDTLEYSCNQLFFINFRQLFESNSLFDRLLNAKTEIFVFKFFQRPKAEVHAVNHKKLQKCFFRLFACNVKVILVISFGSSIVISQGFQLFSIDFYMLCLCIGPCASLTNQFGFVKHIQYRQKRQYFTQYVKSTILFYLLYLEKNI